MSLQYLYTKAVARLPLRYRLSCLKYQEERFRKVRHPAYVAQRGTACRWQMPVTLDVGDSLRQVYR